MGTKTHRELPRHRITRRVIAFSGVFPTLSFLFLLAVGLLAGAAAAQKRDINRPETVWPKDDASIIRMIASGSTEDKRDALFEIRNRETAKDSRLALPALSDKNKIIRATAAGSVVFLPENEAVAVLVPMLRDKSSFVRREAVYALGLVGSRSATGSLIEKMRRDGDREVRAAATVALGLAGDPAAVKPLLDFLKTKPNEDKEFQRRSAARAIGQIAQIARGGKKMAVTPQSFLPERFKEYYTPDQAIPPSLAAIFAPAVPVLSGILQQPKESDDTRREAAFSLGAIGDPSASDVLRASLASPDYYLAEIALDALRNIEKQ